MRVNHGGALAVSMMNDETYRKFKYFETGGTGRMVDVPENFTGPKEHVSR
jgi:hypothetical protein